MWQWLGRFLGLIKKEKVQVDPAFLERVVGIAGARIRLADDYDEQLAPLIVSACQQACLLEKKLPPPVDLTPESWRKNRLLSLIFSNPDRMISIAAANEEVRQWFDAHPLAQQAYAIMAVTRSMQNRTGMEEQNGIVRNDVMQKVIVFSDQRFGALVETPEMLAQHARRRAVEELAHHVARRLSGLEAEKKIVEDELNTLRISLRMGGADRSLSASSLQRDRLKRIETLSTELVNLRASLEPDAQLNMLMSVLRNPEQELRVEQMDLCVDLLGVIRSCGTQAQKVSLFEIEMASDEESVRRVLVPVRIPRDLLQKAAHGQAEAAIFNATI